MTNIINELENKDENKDENENKERPEKAESLLCHLVAEDSLNGAIEPLDDRLEEILTAARNDFDPAGTGTHNPDDHSEDNRRDED
jgi:hypothetical protein